MRLELAGGHHGDGSHHTLGTVTATCQWWPVLIVPLLPHTPSHITREIPGLRQETSSQCECGLVAELETVLFCPLSSLLAVEAGRRGGGRECLSLENIVSLFNIPPASHLAGKINTCPRIMMMITVHMSRLPLVIICQHPHTASRGHGIPHHLEC